MNFRWLYRKSHSVLIFWCFWNFLFLRWPFLDHQNSLTFLDFPESGNAASVSFFYTPRDIDNWIFCSVFFFPFHSCFLRPFICVWLSSIWISSSDYLRRNDSKYFVAALHFYPDPHETLYWNSETRGEIRVQCKLQLFAWSRLRKSCCNSEFTNLVFNLSIRSRFLSFVYFFIHRLQKWTRDSKNKLNLHQNTGRINRKSDFFFLQSIVIFIRNT